jgi:hypothetical protein
LNVAIVGVRTADGETDARALASSALEWTRRFLPVSEVNIRFVLDEPLDARHDYTTRPGWEALLDDLRWLNDWTDDRAEFLHYHGLLPSGIPSSYSGMGYMPGMESAALYLARGGSTTAHELGHNFNLGHAPCGDVNYVNEDYPQYMEPDGPWYPRASIGEWGINLFEYPYTLYDPERMPDLMGYCNPRFTSLYSYAHLGGQIGVAQAEPGGLGRARSMQVSEDFLVGSGWIDAAGLVLRRGFFRMTLPPDAAVPLDEGEFSVELHASDGTMLLRRAFDLLSISEFPVSDQGSFHLIVPWVRGTARVTFFHGERSLGSVTASPHSPTVEVVEPNGGESWPESGTVRVHWEAGDADGGPLQAAVQYSTDGGATWYSAAQNAQGTEVELDAARVPGGAQAIVRVCVSDGMNTECDVSDRPFSVPSKGPEVFLTSPFEGAVFPFGEVVVFEGMAADPEDGSIEEATAYQWYSDRDGSLGYGRTLWGLPLSEGRHTITLTVVDQDGLGDSATVSIVVGSEPQGGRPPGWVVAIVGGLLALATLVAIGMIVAGLRGSRRARG